MVATLRDNWDAMSQRVPEPTIKLGRGFGCESQRSCPISHLSQVSQNNFRPWSRIGNVTEFEGETLRITRGPKNAVTREPAHRATHSGTHSTHTPKPLGLRPYGQ